MLDGRLQAMWQGLKQDRELKQRKERGALAPLSAIEMLAELELRQTARTTET